ncbi:predicted protein [Naegleria gruberi]|uniref:Predicted protein n=1 Tax=Naegleria gruberi TaxID=5762 RepID=D2VHG6_NAEGR|nr:uncharacterized protein NAEGRDRAFT_68320 [Naegleria gruberi]EFC43676.1 predicted protein [Naegleria gruberi]|eukprot:XP_002676420.1 predicted protein [Naegleria gruberi strain NEG-M]
MYWDLRREFGGGSSLGERYVPPNYNKDIDLVDPLQQLAYHSLRYDHLGGPPYYYVNELKKRQKPSNSEMNEKDEEQWVVLLEQNMHPNRTLVNPNHAWDISSSAGTLMKRVFHFNNFLHLVTVLLHIGLIIPLSTSILGIGDKLAKNSIRSNKENSFLSLVRFITQFLMTGKKRQ